VFRITALHRWSWIVAFAFWGCRGTGGELKQSPVPDGIAIETALVLAYDFEPIHLVGDGTSSTVANAAPGGTPGNVHGATAAEGRSGMGIHFDGDDWIDTGLDQTVAHRAFAFWIRADAVPQKDVIPFGTMRDESRLYLGFPPEDNTVGLGIGPVSYYGKGMPWVQDTLWHLVVLNRVDGQARLYLDGKQVMAMPDGTVDAAGIYFIGAINKAHLGQAMHHFRGTIDSVRIWARSLSEREITALSSEK
jgi:Concanavalin A-like lectin/glucanases superfamily